MAIADDSTAPQTKEIKKSFADDSVEVLQAVIDKCDVGDLNIMDKIIKGKPGYAISKYAKN